MIPVIKSQLYGRDDRYVQIYQSLITDQAPPPYTVEKCVQIYSSMFEALCEHAIKLKPKANESCVYITQSKLSGTIIPLGIAELCLRIYPSTIEPLQEFVLTTIREQIISRIILLLENRLTNVDNHRKVLMRKKFPRWASQLELVLYTQSNSIEEYSNFTTLSERLDQIGIDNSFASASYSDSSVSVSVSLSLTQSNKRSREDNNNSTSQEFKSKSESKSESGSNSNSSKRGKIGEDHELTEQESLEKKRSVELHLKLLTHCSDCYGCKYENCKNMKEYLEHKEQCANQTTCKKCNRVQNLLLIHSSKCMLSDCPVKGCYESKAMTILGNISSNSVSNSVSNSDSNSDSNSVSNTSSNSVSNTSSSNIQSKVVLDEQQLERIKESNRRSRLRLLLLKHTAGCDDVDCKVVNCKRAHILWKHITGNKNENNGCINKDCKIDGCVISRCALKHYACCKDDRCSICVDVIAYGKKV
jgi:hypothetical protein